MTIPKKVQDQLLAQLPPNQAKKLSRTLSMQNEPHKATTQKVFKRSSSGGRDLCDPKPDLLKDVCDSRSNALKPDRSLDKSSRSPSRGQDSGDDQSKSFRSSYSSDTSERFKLLNSESGNQIPRYYDTLPSCGSSSSSSITTTVINRPPRSGCLSPPPLPSDNSVRRRSSQRRVSRFLRPDFYDTPLEESIYLDQHPTSDSGRILRDIRERSRERSADRRRDSSADRLNYLTEKYTTKEKHKSCMPDIQNHQINCPQYNPELISNTLEKIRRRRSQSRSRDESEVKIQNTDSLINELQSLSDKRSADLRQEASREELPHKSESDMVTKLNNQIDSVGLLSDQKKAKRESKLARPKSYPTKELEKAATSPPDKEESSKETSPQETSSTKEDTKANRPKSFQPSKITPPKDVKKEKKAEKSPAKSEEAKTKVKVSKKSAAKATDATEKQPKDNKSPEKAAKKSFLQTISQKFERLKEGSSKKKVTCDKNNNLIPNETETKEILERNKSVAKVTKDVIDPQPSSTVTDTTKEANKQPRILVTEGNENDVSVVVILKKKPLTPKTEPQQQSPVESIPPPPPPPSQAPQMDLLKLKEKKSKIDDMIRNLRERSVPRGPLMTESNLIKRAVSVEEIPGTYNKCGVNKVLGLFKKIDKESTAGVGKSQIAKPSNGLQSPTGGEPGKERPKSSGFVSKIKKTYPYVGAKSDSIVAMTEQTNRKIPAPISRIPLKPCPDCKKEIPADPSSVQKREIKQTKEEKDRIKNNRKGLMLDLTPPPAYSNSLLTPSEASLSLVDTPKEEMVTSLTSSDSKNSNFDDCGASSSAFLSPTDEPELYFDNWSVCSEDRRILMSPPPLAIPRPMSTSNSNQEYDPENMLDRIRRKSFYTRFNEKKPKRVSSIVGPGALKDYYSRDGSINRSSSRGPELSKSAAGGLSESGDSSSYRSSIGRTKSATSAKPLENGNHLANGSGSSAYRMTSSDYLNNNGHSHHSQHQHHHHHHHHHLPPSTPSSTSSSSRRSGDELRKYSSDLKSTSSIRNPLTTSSSRSNGLYNVDNRSNSSIYGTYNPKRRISYGNSPQISSSSGIPSMDSPTSASSYATLGRKPKTYDQRTVSLLDSSTLTSSPSLYRRESSRSGIDYTNIGR